MQFVRNLSATKGIVPVNTANYEEIQMEFVTTTDIHLWAGVNLFLLFFYVELQLMMHALIHPSFILLIWNLMAFYTGTLIFCKFFSCPSFRLTGASRFNSRSA